jgi:hypothetical protein
MDDTCDDAERLKFQTTILFVSRIYWIVDEPKTVVGSECYGYQCSYEKNGQMVGLGYGELGLSEV